MRFAGKHVAITGGAGDIGLAMAQQFADEGAKITLLDKAIQPNAERAAVAMGARFVAMDVTDPGQVASVVDAMPALDVAVANAGVHRGARLLELPLENWRLQIDVNLTGAFLFVQAAARKMASRGAGGAILLTGSWVQDVPSVDNTAYCVSKSGASMLARCAALELGEHRIRVNVVAPGSSTPAWRVARSKWIRFSRARRPMVCRSADCRPPRRSPRRPPISVPRMQNP